MIPRNPASSKGSSIRAANVVDARAAVGNLQAKRRQAAMIAVANDKGLPATSATSAAIMQNNMDTKQRLREEIAMLRDVIAEDQWPTEFWLTSAEGEEVTVMLAGKAEAEALLETLETRLQAASDAGQLMQLQLQDAMNKQQQATQTVSNIMKSSHDTAMAVIRNLRA